MIEKVEEKEMAEIRRIRHQISAQFEHDPHKVVAYYRNLEKEYRETLQVQKDKNLWSQ